MDHNQYIQTQQQLLKSLHECSLQDSCNPQQIYQKILDLTSQKLKKKKDNKKALKISDFSQKDTDFQLVYEEYMDQKYGDFPVEKMFTRKLNLSQLPDDYVHLSENCKKEFGFKLIDSKGNKEQLAQEYDYLWFLQFIFNRILANNAMNHWEISHYSFPQNNLSDGFYSNILDQELQIKGQQGLIIRDNKFSFNFREQNLQGIRGKLMVKDQLLQSQTQLALELKTLYNTQKQQNLEKERVLGIAYGGQELCAMKYSPIRNNKISITQPIPLFTTEHGKPHINYNQLEILFFNFIKMIKK